MTKHEPAGYQPKGPPIDPRRVFAPGTRATVVRPPASRPPVFTPADRAGLVTYDPASWPTFLLLDRREAGWFSGARAALTAWGLGHDWPALRLSAWATLLAGEDHWDALLAHGSATDLAADLAAALAAIAAHDLDQDAGASGDVGGGRHAGETGA